MSNSHFIKRTDINDDKQKVLVPNLPQKFIPSISLLKFPFSLKQDQIAAVNAWINNNYRGTILYSTGTGKTEIAFECAKRLASCYLPDSNNKLSINTNENFMNNANMILKDKDPSYSNAYKSSSLVNDNTNNISYSFFNILFLVPRISLIDQTINRLISYGIPKEKVAAYFGERKEIAEIIISTYHSAIRNTNLIRRSNMVIFDEVHLIRDTSRSFIQIFDIVIEDPKRAILGLTATLDKKDLKNNTILTVLPPVIEYTVKSAVKDRRLAKPVVIPIKVNLTEKEQKDYDTYSTKIKNISNRFKRYDANSMTDLLKKGGFVSGMAKAWFSNIRKRKLLLSYAENKLFSAANIISKKFPNEKIMVFSETIESIEKLQDLLKGQGIESKIIDAKVKVSERQRILDNWGINFNVLLSVHTLEIGYDVPQVRIEIILATTSNINQIIQRIGRVLRKYEGKNVALIYVIYIPDTKDDNVIEVVQKAIEENNDHKNIEIINTQNHTIRKTQNGKSSLMIEKESKTKIYSTIPSSEKAKLIQAIDEKNRNNINYSKKINKNIESERFEKKVQKAYGLIESSLQQESFIIEYDDDINKEKLDNKDFKEFIINKPNSNTDDIKLRKKATVYRVKSSKNENKFYIVDVEKKSCTCADFIYRRVKCKHIIATEIILP
jgi:superfamily II DNA or RNA helicase